MTGDVCSTLLSDDEFSKEECDDLKEKVKAGLLKKLTIVELEQKAKILHEDITKHRIARELKLLQKLIERANEKGWRQEYPFFLFFLVTKLIVFDRPKDGKFSADLEHLQKKKLLQQPSYMSFVLQNIPGVIPEEVELESVDRNDNQMHQCLYETTPTKKNVPGVIPEEVEL